MDLASTLSLLDSLKELSTIGHYNRGVHAHGDELGGGFGQRTMLWPYPSPQISVISLTILFELDKALSGLEHSGLGL